MGLGLPGSLPSYHISYTFCCYSLMANKIFVVVGGGACFVTSDVQFVNSTNI